MRPLQLMIYHERYYRVVAMNILGIIQHHREKKEESLKHLTGTWVWNSLLLSVSRIQLS